MALKSIVLALLLFTGSAFAEDRQAQSCPNGRVTQLGFCAADLSAPAGAATGATTGTVGATSDETDGTRYACATSSATPLTCAQIQACSGGTAVNGDNAAETGSNNIALTGLTEDAAHYGQSCNVSPETRVSDVVVSASFTPSAGGFAYTPTHFVAPFASVAGASSDEDTTATAFTSCTSSGTPCTLGEAMAEATAGDVVRIGQGVYYGTETNDRNTPAFEPANNGALGNPIIFFAEYPSAYNYGSTSLYSELRKSGFSPPPVASSNEGSVMGAMGQDYIIFDGFFAKFSTAFPGGTAGVFRAAAGSIGVEFRRIAIAADTAPPISGWNANGIWIGESTGTRIVDSYFDGAANGSHNQAAIETYGAIDLVIENNTFDNLDGYGVYIKGTDPINIGFNTDVIIRKNRFVDGSMAVGVTQGAQVYSNLFTGTLVPGVGAFDYESSGEGYEDVHVFNNTIAITGGSYNGIVVEDSPTLTGGGNRFYNNIVNVSSAITGGGEIVNGGTATPFTIFDVFNYNYYYEAGNTPDFSANGSAYSGITAWRAGLATQGMVTAARETNSAVSDVTFEDEGGDDYRLAENSQDALTASDIGGRIGAYITGSEEIGVRAVPTY